MQRISFLLIMLLGFCAVSVTAQDTLPAISVKNLNGQIIVSWVNNYKTPVANLNIQRSFDSLRNYTTVGSVLNPQNIENGYADSKPPYSKMYYRVFVSFEGGRYLFSNIARPVKVQPEVVQTVNADGTIAADTSYPFLIRNKLAIPTINDPKQNNTKIQPKTQLPPINSNTEIITYPSRRIYSGKDNNVVIYLPDAATKKYIVKFFEENDTPIFELNKLPEPYLIIEKVNFVHAGWFYFEVYENGKLIEKNKFYVLKDGKNQQPPPLR
jgi:hypothetical protein